MPDLARSVPALVTALLLAASPLAAAAQSPAPEQAAQARPAPRFAPATRCPQLRVAIVEEQPTAVVLFHVGVTGVPSQASLRASSHSADLDAAAVSCVLKLRFLPATRLGDGTATDSWQEMALQWARPSEHQAASPAGVTSPASSSGLPAAPSSPPSAAVSAEAEPHAPAAGAAVVRACIDASGKLAAEPVLVHSSGDPGFDRAALGVARSGSVAYRPAPGGKADPRCLRLAISPEAD